MTVRTTNIAEIDRSSMGCKLLNSLAHFRTRKEAERYAKSVGWRKSDVLRVHGTLYGYRWIIADSHYNAVHAEPYEDALALPATIDVPYTLPHYESEWGMRKRRGKKHSLDGYDGARQG